MAGRTDGALAARTDRATGGLLGLAVGDAMGWPSLVHRSHRLPFWTRRIRRELDAETEETGSTSLPVPFSLNQPPDLLRLGPTDDAEWAAFTARVLAGGGREPEPGALTAAWRALGEEGGPVRGRISVLVALRNLEAGLEPPASGHDNPHYMDDAACIRAVPVGIAWAGEPVRAAEVARREASVTNALDGVWGAGAVAAAVAVACGGGRSDDAVAAAMAELPPDSWIGRTVREALAITGRERTLFAALPVLSDEIVNRVYSYGSLAPETVALTLAIVRLSGGDPAAALPAAATIIRTADSLPALVGALCGALGGAAALPAAWVERCRTLQGVCLPHLAGTDLVALAEELARLGT